MGTLTTFIAPASNRLTLVLILLLILTTALYPVLPKPVALGSLLLPSALLMMNFVLAIIRKRILVNKPFLLVFHLALFLLIVELVIGQLTYLKGTAEVGTGTAFSGQLENIAAGPLHEYQLEAGMFTNLGFNIHYHAGVQRNNTINRIRLEEGDGAARVVEIGDHIPLIIGHYRFYTSHNKGYAPIFTWIPADGRPPMRGSVHLPAYPEHEYEQEKEWSLPGTRRQIWTLLMMEEEVLPENREFSFPVPQKHHLVVRVDNKRHTLRVGDELTFTDGTLRYDVLSSWMGYKVDYDWTRPWLLATCLLALLSLSMHFLVASFRS